MVRLTAKDIADEVVRQMKADKDINFRQELTPFQKTEKFLYNLKFLKGALDVKSRKLTGLKNAPVLLQKKDLGVNVQATKKYIPEIEKIENMIENLEGEIGKIQNVISSVEEALKNIEDEKEDKEEQVTNEESVSASSPSPLPDPNNKDDKEMEELKEKWGKGSFKNVEDSVEYHFNEHGEEVGANDIRQYLRKAKEFARNLKRARIVGRVKGKTPGVI